MAAVRASVLSRSTLYLVPEYPAGPETATQAWLEESKGSHVSNPRSVRLTRPTALGNGEAIIYRMVLCVGQRSGVRDPRW